MFDGMIDMLGLGFIKSPDFQQRMSALYVAIHETQKRTRQNEAMLHAICIQLGIDVGGVEPGIDGTGKPAIACNDPDRGGQNIVAKGNEQ